MACQPTVLRQRKKENQGTLQRQVGIHFSSLGWNFVFIWNWTNFHYVDTKSITEQYLSFHSKWVSNSGKRLIRETDHAFEACPSPLLLLLLLSRFSRVRLCDPIDGSPRGSPHPWDSPGKNTGVGCHFLLQCMKVKSESEIAQSCPTLSDPMDSSLPGFSTHGIF